MTNTETGWWKQQIAASSFDNGVRLDFLRDCNTAVEAANLGKVCEVNYFLTSAHELAVYLGWAQNRDAYLAVQDECISIIQAKRAAA